MTQLKVKKRETSEKVSKLREKKLVPAVVYGQGKEGVNLAINAIEFDKVYEEAGESSLVDLNFEDGTSKKVLIHEVQLNPIKNQAIHVDFYEVDLTKKVTTNVELEFIGEAPVVKNEGGIVIKKLDEIEIECLPSDLIKKFKVDISGLTDFSSVIHVKDLQISDKITILDNPDDVVVNVSEPRMAEEEIKPEAEPVVGEGGEAKEGAGKKEGGATASEGAGKKE